MEETEVRGGKGWEKWVWAGARTVGGSGAQMEAIFPSFRFKTKCS